MRGFRAPLHFRARFCRQQFSFVLSYFFIDRPPQIISTMASSLCSSNLMRLAISRRAVLASRYSGNNRGIRTVAAVADRGGSSAARWTSNDETAPHRISLSAARFFSAASSSEEEDTTPAPTKEEEEVKDLHKESLQFQAETKQLLDIVTHSLYTDKEVFLRELVSNASDALEKLRHLQVANIEGKEVVGNDVPLEIRIETDELNQTLTISDTGVGLTKEDMISNLGTIAKSGSKAFLNEISNAASQDPQLDPAKGIIGKFGVGFYSAFMVGDKVDVRSRYDVVLSCLLLSVMRAECRCCAVFRCSFSHCLHTYSHSRLLMGTDLPMNRMQRKHPSCGVPRALERLILVTWMIPFDKIGERVSSFISRTSTCSIVMKSGSKPFSKSIPILSIFQSTSMAISSIPWKRYGPRTQKKWAMMSIQHFTSLWHEPLMNHWIDCIFVPMRHSRLKPSFSFHPFIRKSLAWDEWNRACRCIRVKC